ncbi:MAG TPA: adenylate/guanylate cyclase domain-containing protein [Phenylobacterium sp.]|uniref:adenylate/guanylate cyclase domain-containing protein n=1 Tax=Phenylobacterium sp. TaxID=1871053 RepID=UPI002CCB2FCF|nr:adenylate/guanylate cyclase domain-containing protein [Phenylobacterium sp.]HSV03010.1 adenylate/guanylate cyclase domain-containing protein [Phenylobacterium sp.]
MTAPTRERRLSAILAADVAGYSRLVAADEEGALARFAALLGEVIRPAVGRRGGEVIKTTGDGVLATFASAAAGLHAALEIQAGVAERSADLAPERRLLFRIGLHVADVVVEAGDVFGDGVNVAARLQAMADPGGVLVSSRVQEDTQGRVEAVFEDMGPQQLKNIPRSVQVYRVRAEGPAPAAATPRLPLPSKPSIVVLPFRNMSGDPEQEYFADAVTDDIVTALSRWRWFFVIGRNSSFAYKDREVDVSSVGRDLGVRYVLQGSVRRAGPRMRVSAQLIEASDATHVWAENYDREVTDVLAVQDEITEHVVGAIEPAMLQSEGVRTARKDLADFDALDFYQRGMWHLNKVSRESCKVAVGFFRRAIERDPDLPLGYIGLARAFYGAAVYGWSERPLSDLAEAREVARKAIRLDPRDAYGYFACSGASLYLGRHREALEEARKTIALNPNFAFGHFRLGQVLVYSGRAAEAIGPIERSIRYSPYDPQLGAMRSLLALAHFHAGQYEAAIRHAESATALHDLRASGVIAASLVRLGRLEEAQAAFASEDQDRARRTRVPRLSPYARPADRDGFVEALKVAGVGDSLLERIS